jgi:hypothetical protein
MLPLAGGSVGKSFERRRKTPPNSSLEQGAPAQGKPRLESIAVTAFDSPSCNGAIFERWHAEADHDADLANIIANPQPAGPSSAADAAKDPYEYGGSDEDFQDDVGRAAKKPRAASVPPSSPTPLPPTRSVFARPPVRKPAWLQVANSSKMFGSGSQVSCSLRLGLLHV